jgi:hypothetical protein
MTWRSANEIAAENGVDEASIRVLVGKGYVRPDGGGQGRAWKFTEAQGRLVGKVVRLRRAGFRYSEIETMLGLKREVAGMDNFSACNSVSDILRKLEAMDPGNGGGARRDGATARGLAMAKAEGVAFGDVLKRDHDLLKEFAPEPEPTGGLTGFERLEVRAAHLRIDDPNLSKSAANSLALSDPAINAAYSEWAAGRDPVEAERAEKAAAATREALALRKAATSRGKIPLADVEVLVGGERETDAERARAWVSMALDSYSARRFSIVLKSSSGAVIGAADVDMAVL